ncbi:hypothetical protein CR513_16443, partial [Mucuna pruriens]
MKAYISSIEIIQGDGVKFFIIEHDETLELKYRSIEKGMNIYSCKKMIVFQMICEFENIVYVIKLKRIVLLDILFMIFMISKLSPSLRTNIIFLKRIYKNLNYKLRLTLLKILNNVSYNINKLKDKNKRNGFFCFVCGQTNHFAKNRFQHCRQPIFASKLEANVVTDSATFNSLSNRYHVISPELNCVFNSNDRFIDCRANAYVCANKKLFSLYKESSTYIVSMRNESMTHVLGEGQVNLELSSCHCPFLDGVYCVSDIRRNLISTFLLVQQGHKIVFGSNRVVITRHGVFVSKCYICDNLWHVRLRHVNLKFVKRMIFVNLILKAYVDLKQKFKICVQAKQPRKPFNRCIEKDTKLLELVHSDVCDSNEMLTHDVTKVICLINSKNIKQRYSLHSSTHIFLIVNFELAEISNI